MCHSIFLNINMNVCAFTQTFLTNQRQDPVSREWPTSFRSVCIFVPSVLLGQVSLCADAGMSEPQRANVDDHGVKDEPRVLLNLMSLKFIVHTIVFRQKTKPLYDEFQTTSSFSRQIFTYLKGKSTTLYSYCFYYY